MFEGLLTRRELEVLRLLAEGRSNRSIAEALVITPGTVKFHVNRILRKLHVANRSQAVSRYLRLAGDRGPLTAWARGGGRRARLQRLAHARAENLPDPAGSRLLAVTWCWAFVFSRGARHTHATNRFAEPCFYCWSASLLRAWPCPRSRVRRATAPPPTAAGPRERAGRSGAAGAVATGNAHRRQTSSRPHGRAASSAPANRDERLGRRPTRARSCTGSATPTGEFARCVNATNACCYGDPTSCPAGSVTGFWNDPWFKALTSASSAHRVSYVRLFVSIDAVSPVRRLGDLARLRPLTACCSSPGTTRPAGCTRQVRACRT